MGILQENQNSSYAPPKLSNQVSAFIQPQITDPVNTMASSRRTIQHRDPMTYTPSFQSAKAHRGSDTNKSTVSDDISQYSLTLSPHAVDKMAFRERIEKWISEVEHGEWKAGVKGSEGEDSMIAGGFSCSKRRKRDRKGRYMVGDNNDEVRGKKSRVEERENGDGGVREGCEMEIMKDLERKSSREERNP